MVPSRALLFLVAALALPLSVLPGCGDDSAPKEESDENENPEDEEDKGGEQADARVIRMDGSVRSDAGSNSAMDGATTDKDSGEPLELDSSMTPVDASTPDASTTDASTTDAAADGMDASQDAGRDAKVDSGKDAEVDAGEEEEDAGQDAGQDAGRDAGDAGDAGQTYTEEDCEEADGVVKDDDAECAEGETKYELAQDKICCVKEETPLDAKCGAPMAPPCAEGLFCDKSTGAGGDGCVEDALGVCKPIPTGCSFPFGALCACQDIFYFNACDAYKAGATVDTGNMSCLSML